MFIFRILQHFNQLDTWHGVECHLDLKMLKKMAKTCFMEVPHNLPERTEKTIRNSFKISGLQAEIQTREIPHTKLM
jgi:hypothetical protein